MKKNLISVIILALLIVNIVLTGIMMFSVLGTNKKTASLVTDVASAINLELEGGWGNAVDQAAMIPLEETATYTVADMTIPMKRGENDEKDHFGVLTVVLSMNTKHEDYKTYGEGDLSGRADLIKGKINDAVGQYTADEAKSDPQAVKEAILTSVQQLYGSDFIFDVTLSSAIYQ